MKHKYTIGIDEVGRGPLAGPVSVCAILIPNSLSKKDFRGARDSKKMSPGEREALFIKLKGDKDRGIIRYSVASTSSKKIDEIGISKAIKSALSRAINNLDVVPGECRVLLDGGLSAPKCFQNQETIVHGDDKEYAISLASIVAKVTRDRKMERLAKLYPKYLFDTHKGYGTKAHFRKLREHGLCKIHRKSFIHL